MAKKSEMQKSEVSRKEFGFTKDGVQLNFTLRVDNTSELRPFKECLSAALESVDQEIAKLKN